MCESPAAKRDVASLDDIKVFVDSFYERVQNDEKLGPVFNDISRVEWSRHLDVMYRFWDSVLFASGTYKGNPLAVHLAVNNALSSVRNRTLADADFERWLTLFFGTIDELFDGNKANQAKRSAMRMAKHLQVVCASDYQDPPLKLVAERHSE